MKRLALVLVAAIGVVAFGASPASAATECRGNVWDTTVDDYAVHYDRYRALAPHEGSEVYRQMNCASVGYVMRTIRHKVRNRHGWPYVPDKFYDGYVTWYCYTASARRKTVECAEYDSNTGFRFRARVY